MYVVQIQNYYTYLPYLYLSAQAVIKSSNVCPTTFPIKIQPTKKCATFLVIAFPGHGSDSADFFYNQIPGILFLHYVYVAAAKSY